MKQLPKYFYKLSLPEQESFMSKMLQQNNEDHDIIMRMLGAIRGGYKYEVAEIDRPDLMDMKEEQENNNNNG